MPRVQSLLSALPDDYALTLADIGSAGGLQQRWGRVAARVNALLFEPREAADGVTREGRNRIFPVALGAAAGTATLNVTQMANMSSLRQPNMQLMQQIRKKCKQAVVVAQHTVPVESLDVLLEREQLLVDALKIDTQGTELEILTGAQKALRDSVVLAEVEVSFVERYVGQATAATLINWMQERDLQLIEIYRPKRYRYLNSSGIRNVGVGGGHRAGQLAFADAVFALTPEGFMRRRQRLSRDAAGRSLLSMLVSLVVYGKIDMAAAWLDHHEDLLDAPRQAALRHWFAGWRRSHMARGGLHQMVDYIARKI